MLYARFALSLRLERESIKIMLDLELLSEKIRDIAVNAGHFLEEASKDFDRNRVEEKSPHNYVSYIDKSSEKLLIKELSALLPEAGFIAEEGSGSLTTQEYCWVIDPLDGTTNYIHRMGPYAVSIALRNREELLIGVVYEVTRKECYYAWKGSKAYLNGQEIHVSNISTLDKAFIDLGFPYDSNHYHTMAVHLVDKLYGRAGGSRLLGSAASEICYIAAGRFEARVEAFLGPWDVAAAGLILMQAGGKLTDFVGGNSWTDAEQVIASNGPMHDIILRMVQEKSDSIL